MKRRFKKLWKRYVILPWLKKNKAEAVLEMRNAIVYQMRHGGIPLQTVNKWLRVAGSPEISGYVLEGPNKDVRLLYGKVTDEQREKYRGEIKWIK